MGLGRWPLNIDAVDSDCRRTEEPLGLCIGRVGDVNHLDVGGPLFKLQSLLQVLNGGFTRLDPSK